MIWFKQIKSYTKRMDNTSFADLKPRIIEAIDKVLNQDPQEYTIENGFEILEGFISMPLQPDLVNFNIGSTNVPTVGIIGKKTGKLYFFALGQLLPDVLKEFNDMKKSDG